MFKNSLLLTKNWISRLVLTYLALVTFFVVIFVHIHGYSNVSLKLLTDFSENDKEIIQCHFPQLSLNSNYLTFPTPTTVIPVCRSWFHPIIIENYTLRLIFSYLHCTVIFYIGQGDQEYQKISIILSYNMTIPLLSDHFSVQCEDKVKKQIYPDLSYASIHYNPSVQKRLANVKKQKDDFNVLILGLDSVSRLQFERMLPDTFNYVTKDLNGILLKGYNILGDGTPQQLIPMLTGFKETELPSTLYRDPNSSFVDVYPFIWNKYREQGYVTGYAEDRVEYGIWTLRLKGFEKTPTDHYLSPFYRMEATKSLLNTNDAHCIHNQTSFDLFLSYIDQFWSTYSENKKFFFGFFKQYTHDGYIATKILDSSLLRFLQNLKRKSDYDKTIIILMTDHGARFSIARQTPQGKLEERLPFMSFIFPKEFQIKYSKAIKNLEKNLYRLTTPFDIHSTLLSLINMNAINYTEKYPAKQRNISLFQLIPAQRICDDVSLEPHWCSCLQWKNLNISDSQVQKATKHIVNHINSQLLLVKDNLCHQLEVLSIHNAQKYQPNQALLTFSSSSDIDGRIPVYDDTTMDIVFYQITFETQPNRAIYEATTQYSNKSNLFSTDLNHISRLNAYKSSALCIEKTYSHLRKFCQCIQ